MQLPNFQQKGASPAIKLPMINIISSGLNPDIHDVTLVSAITGPNILYHSKRNLSTSVRDIL